MTPGVSVIICCYNSVSRIQETLRHLSLQETEPSLLWEIIVVDNASTDDTGKVVIDYWNALNTTIKLSVIREPQAGLSYARATGIKLSAYEVIVFCDDDNWLCVDYIQTAYNIISANPGIGLLGGEGIPIADQHLPAWFESYKTSYACYPQSDEDGELKNAYAALYGAGLILRKKSWVNLTRIGFNSMLTDRKGKSLSSGGDVELSFAIRLSGYSLWYSSKLKFYHYMDKERLTISYIKKLNKSLAYCSIKLQLYRYALTGKSVNVFTWIKDMIYKTLFLVQAIFVFSNKRDTEFRWYNFHFAFYSWLGMISMFNNYTFQYGTVLKLIGIRK